MAEPRQEGETQAGISQSDLNQDEKLALMERQLRVLLDEVHELQEDRSKPDEPGSHE